VSEIGDGVFEVKSTNGDTFLAAKIRHRPGRLPGRRIRRKMASTCATTAGVQRLKDAAEKAKSNCGARSRPKSNLHFITADPPVPTSHHQDHPRQNWNSWWTT